MILKKAILDQLDQCAEDFTFPMFDNGYIYPVDTKLSAYRDERRWVLIIEVIGFNFRGGGHDGINNCLHIFGNCLSFPPGTHTNNFLYFTDDSTEGNTFEQESLDSLNPEIKTFLIRGEEREINHDPSFYEAKGIALEQSPKVKAWEFLRGLVPECRKDFFANDEEIKARIPKDIPLLLALTEWHHPNLSENQLPSESETFQQLAEALEKGNAALYKPSLIPNTHWKNWPEGGTL